ncbi:MAG: glycogen-binding domain-containing protein [Kiritimatiellae bacterium]|nr:glycogen-binding domain-containing protein [Kiritimatiellia bacterium]
MKIKATKKPAAEKVVAKKTRVCKAAAAPAVKPVKPAKTPVTFTVHADKGKEVFLAGEFNGWDPAAKKLAYKARAGVYTTTLNLEAGTYQYKFVIDGTWCADPENVNSVQNDQGTFNSVIEVK